jgi:sirohydrochlorin ferrochelatase
MEKHGILVISHGSRSSEWVELVETAVAGARFPADIPVFCSYLELVEGKLIQDGIDHLERLGVTDIIVIPLFVSSGSTHIDEISYALGVKDTPLLPTDLTPFHIRARIHMASPIDDDPVIADILIEKISPLSVAPDKELLLLIGHGSVEKGFHAKWRRGMEQLAERLKTLGGFAGAATAMLLPNQVPFQMKLWSKRLPMAEYTVIVVPLFLSEGYFTKQVIPERLQGYDYRYNGQALLPHEGLSRWIERQAEPLLANG